MCDVLICKKCGETKLLDAFAKSIGTKSGRTRTCKLCANAACREKYRENPGKKQAQNSRWAKSNRGKRNAAAARLREKDPARFMEYNRKFEQAHPGAAAIAQKRYRSKPESKVKHATDQREWRAANPEKQREKSCIANKKLRERNRDNPNFRLREQCRARILGAIKRGLEGGFKGVGTLELLGCTIEQFRVHVEALWQPGMTWGNWRKKGWHIDHIRPCASFDLSDIAQQRACFHYTNTQPLWWDENLRKGAKYEH